MKDIVVNRRRLSLPQKLRLLGLVLKENGLAWTGSLGVYYLASSLSEKAYGVMDALRQKRNLPGLNSARLNTEIWNAWDWSGGGEEWTPSEEWKQSLIRNVMDRLVPDGADILEIGPGAGRWTEHLLARARSLVGVDISESCVAICREKFARDSKARFFANNGASLAGIADGSVDVVWSYDVFVHINAEEAARYAAEFARVLRAGGRGIVHHGTVAGSKGGWRSNLTDSRFAELLEAQSLKVAEQFTEWEDPDGAKHKAGLYEDALTVFEKPKNQHAGLAVA